MVFTSFAFLKFFIVVLLGLCLLPRREYRQAFILAASAFFYAYWKPSYLLLLAAPSLIDYVCALRIEQSQNGAVRRRWLIASLVTNLGLLAYFKYTNFFLESLSLILPVRLPSLDIVLPVGISFFIFKTLSYTIDVYRGELPACRSLWRYAMFVTYFPELIAGPIVRASVFLPQMTRSLRPSIQRAQVGMQLILLGITKKLVFADRLSLFVDRVFADPNTYSPSTAILATIAYSIQVYCDFSGYSDMAIGISKIIGFDLPENFDMPYLACSVTEFWRRWHITLSQWLRDYLYISLGGNRRGKFRTYLNLFITMFLAGLWHGAGWTYVFFGCVHGIALVVHKIWREFRGPSGAPSLPARALSWAATYSFVCFSMIFFRATTFSSAWVIIRKVFWLDNTGVTWTYTPLLLLVPLLITGHILGVVAGTQMSRNARYAGPPDLLDSLYSGIAKRRFVLRPHRAAGIYILLPLHNFVGVFCLVSWAVLAFLFSSVRTNPFIYFQF